jgi:predicted metalloprotease with PDZ domain
VDDEIIAIDDFRVRPDQLDARMEQYIVGDRVAVLVARRDRLMGVDVTLGAEPSRSWQLEVDPSATAGQRAGLDFWLAPSGNPVRAG